MPTRLVGLIREQQLRYLALAVTSGTLQLAAGMNLHIFTTGRGTP